MTDGSTRARSRWGFLTVCIALAALLWLGTACGGEEGASVGPPAGETPAAAEGERASAQRAPVSGAAVSGADGTGGNVSGANTTGADGSGGEGAGADVTGVNGSGAAGIGGAGRRVKGDGGSGTEAEGGGAKAPAMAPPRGAVGAAPRRRAVPPAAAMTAADFPTPPERDLWQLARELRWGGVEPTPEPHPLAGRTLAVGEETDFWVLNYPQRKMERRHFRLAAVSANAYWWVEADWPVDDAALARTVAEAEEQVYPRVSAVFGALPASVVGDGNRGHIISGRIRGLGGYVSGADLYPATVNPYSNGVPAIYINVAAAPLGSAGYLGILAHELQHAIHWYADRSEATWLNEGLAELAVTEAGYPVGSLYRYLGQPDVSLVNWPSAPGGDIGLSYGAAALFAHYLREHYAPKGGLHDLLARQEDGIAAVEAFLAGRGAVTAAGAPADFNGVFADWMVANLLDQEEGRYGYAGLEVAAAVTRRQRAGAAGPTVSLPQYAIDYVAVTDGAAGMALHFAGEGTTALLPAEAPEGSCWWSNRGDSIATTLTRRVTVPAAAPDGTPPALTYRYWHDIETDWDYVYIEVSTDGGATWDVLPAAGTTDSNPLGNGYGPGYTGKSDWRRAEVSLAAYAGREARLRFHYVTDDAVHGPGFCVREAEIAGVAAGEWEADGFVLVNNRVRQEWLVWVIGAGPAPTVTRMALEWDAEQGRYTGTAPAPAVGSGERWVVAVAAAAPATMQPGSYRVWAAARD